MHSPRDDHQVFWQELKRRHAGRNRRRWLCLGTAFLLLVLVVVAVSLLLGGYSITLNLPAEDTLTVAYGSEFTAPEAEAVVRGLFWYGEPDTLAVTPQGDVDTFTLGEYQLTYEVRYAVDLLIAQYPLEVSRTLTVQVADLEPPQISLTSGPDTFTLPGESYREEGFAAVDDHDGDLTDQVEWTVGEDSITYTVTDSSGNTAQAVRQIVYSDPVAPVLTLEGASEIILGQWGIYTEPGYQAQDNCLGDITDRVTVSGDVDMEIPGTYVLTYSVTDDYQNAAEVTRTVTVQGRDWIPQMAAGDFGVPVETDEKVIYLTFDDGPSNYTLVLLDILEFYDVKATFFVVNTSCLEYIQAIAEAGHTIAMHSSSHRYDQIYTSETAFFEDLKEIQDLIFKYTGQTSTIVRFPGGSSNKVSKHYNAGIMSRLTQRLDELGYRYYDWDVDSRDASDAKTAEEVYSNVIYHVRGKDVAVVLQHDIYGYSVAAVGKIIQWGLRNGYTFKALDTTSPVCEHMVKN